MTPKQDFRSTFALCFKFNFLVQIKLKPESKNNLIYLFIIIYYYLLNLFNLANSKGTNTHLRRAREEKKKFNKMITKFTKLIVCLIVMVTSCNN